MSYLLPPKFSFKQLTTEDWKTFKDIRLEALEIAHDMFGGKSLDEASLFTDEEWQEKLNSSKNIFYALFKENKAVGIAAVKESKQNEEEAFISSVYITPECRGIGLTNYLFEKSITMAKSRDYKVIWCSMREGNDPIISVCEKFGFVYSHTVSKLWNDKKTAGLIYYKMDFQRARTFT